MKRQLVQPLSSPTLDRPSQRLRPAGVTTNANDAAAERNAVAHLWKAFGNQRVGRHRKSPRYTPEDLPHAPCNESGAPCKWLVVHSSGSDQDFAKRLIRSIQRQCVDHYCLRRSASAPNSENYAAYYNGVRNASVFAKGRAGLACHFGRASSSIRSDLVFGTHTRRRSTDRPSIAESGAAWRCFIAGTVASAPRAGGRHRVPRVSGVARSTRSHRVRRPPAPSSRQS